MELIESYLEKTRKAKRVRGVYVLKLKDLEGEPWDQIIGLQAIDEIGEQWTRWMKNGIVDAPLIIIPDFSDLDYEQVLTFERAIQILRSKGKVRRRIWNAHTHLFVDQDGIIMKYVNHDYVIPYQIETKDMEAVDWELYSPER